MTLWELALNAAQNHTGNEVALQEGIHHQDGQSRDHGDCTTNGDGRGLGGCLTGQSVNGSVGSIGSVHGGGQLHLQQVLQGVQVLLAAAVQLGVEPLVPAANGNEQSHSGQHRGAQGEDDLPEDTHIISTVDAGGLFQRCGDLTEEVHHQNTVPNTEHTGDDVYPEGIVQTQELVHQEGGKTPKRKTMFYILDGFRKKKGLEL